MLHILLFILKIIGIIIAAILGILVLLVCVVLFVPGRYDIEASLNGSPSEIRAAARVTWFLNLVRFNMCYEKKEMTWRLCIAWKSRQSGQEDKKKIKKEVETYDEEMEELLEDLEESGKDEEDKSERSAKILEEVPEESQKGNGESEEGAEKVSESEKSSEEQADADKDLEEQTGIGKDLEEAETGVGKDLEEAETDIGKDLEETETDIGKDLEETETDIGKRMEEDERSGEEGRKRIWQKAAGGCRKIIRKIADLYRKITGIPGRIEEIFQSFSHRIRTLSEKKNKILDFISDEVHKKAFVKVKDESICLLRKLKPKKFLASIHFGFEDPCTTGKLLAGLSMVYPFLGKDFYVSLDFERQVLEGDLKIIGRIRVSYFAKLLWKLIWCKEVRATYRHVRSFEL